MLERSWENRLNASRGPQNRSKICCGVSELLQNMHAWARKAYHNRSTRASETFTPRASIATDLYRSVSICSRQNWTLSGKSPPEAITNERQFSPSFQSWRVVLAVRPCIFFSNKANTPRLRASASGEQRGRMRCACTHGGVGRKEARAAKRAEKRKVDSGPVSGHQKFTSGDAERTVFSQLFWKHSCTVRFLVGTSATHLHTPRKAGSWREAFILESEKGALALEHVTHCLH
jgi:hypothetical protein